MQPRAVRPLSFYESITSFMNISLVCFLEGNVTSTNARAAFDLTRQLHPYLRMKIAVDHLTQRLAFIEDGDQEIQLACDTGEIDSKNWKGGLEAWANAPRDHA
nr:hypothetical protein [Candidatus Sigynarchaeota archaeon]